MAERQYPAYSSGQKESIPVKGKGDECSEDLEQHRCGPYKGKAGVGDNYVVKVVRLLKKVEETRGEGKKAGNLRLARGRGLSYLKVQVRSSLCGRLAGCCLLMEREDLGLVLSLIAAWQVTPGRRDPAYSQHCQLRI